MKRKFEELRSNLDEFVQQTDYPVLLVGALPEEVPYVTQYLVSLDQVHAHSFFLTFTHPFEAAKSYVDLMLESLQVQLADAAPARAEDKLPPLSPVPPALLDPALAPTDKLRGLLRYLPSLLPNVQDHSVVVGILPLSCQDVHAYSRLIASILPFPEIPEWMKALRLVIHDDRGQRSLVRAVSAQPAKTTLSFEVDFSTAALTDALSREASDPVTPLPQRMAYLLQLAALDYSYQRYADSIEKYGVLYRYYEDPATPAMQAVCLLGVGDSLAALGRLEEAKGMLQSGLALCLQHKLLAPMLNLLLSASGLSTRLGQHADAESYAQSGTQVAGELLNPFGHADFLERKADAQLAQGKGEEALATYERCRGTAERYEYFHRWKAVLQKLCKLHEQRGERQEQREREREQLRVQALEKRGGSSSAASPAAAAPATGARS